MKQASLGHRKRAVTLIEILIAFSILVMLFSIIYKLFTSIARTQDIGHWATMTTKEVRNGLVLLRNEISGATEPKLVTQKGTEPFQSDTAKENYLYCPSLPYNNNLTGGNTKILHFFICQPGRKNMPGETNINPEIMSGILEIKDGKLIYNRIIESQPAEIASKTQRLTHVVCNNPSNISLTTKEVDDPSQLSVKNRNFLVLTVTAQHPKYPKTTITETMEAPFEVKLKKGTFP